MPETTPPNRPPTYEELAARLQAAEEKLARIQKEAGERVLSLERLLMQYVAKDRSHVIARREAAQGQPLLDLAAGREPAPGPSASGEE